MTHFVLHARRATLSEADIRRIMDTAGVTVLDNEVGGALLVDTTKDVALELQRRFPGWTIAEEIEYPLPDTQPYAIKKNEGEA